MSAENLAPEVRVMNCVWCGEPVDGVLPETVWVICSKCVKPDDGELFRSIYGRQ